MGITEYQKEVFTNEICKIGLFINIYDIINSMYNLRNKVCILKDTYITVYYCFNLKNIYFSS